MEKTKQNHRPSEKGKQQPASKKFSDKSEGEKAQGGEKAHQAK